MIKSYNKKNVIVWMICMLLILTGCSSNNSVVIQPDTPSTNTSENKSPMNQPDPPAEPVDEVEKLLSTMSIEEKIGQLVLVGMDGTINNKDSQTFIEEYHIGGFIFYKDNIESKEQALQLMNDLKQTNVVNKIPLWMSLDEEGGRVTRMPKDFNKLPTNREIGKKNDVTLSNEIGQLLAKELKGFGLNMNFAPVLDIHSNPNNPVIGDRSFGSKIEVVSRLGIATMQGMESEGIVPVVKHFPGHGDTSVDSHIGLPVVNHSLDRLREFELKPFQDAINQEAEVVMIAHILMPQIDQDHPASLSKIMISDILRDELGFTGVVMTDDMTMGAIVENYDLQQSSVQTILAGSNIVLVGHDVDKGISVIQALTEAVKNGKISEKLLNTRVKPILQLKVKYGLTNEPATGPDVASINKEIQEIIFRLGQKSK
ncbi:beta-N-acetylhexosaminidase [Paenibacillus sp. CMAA1364]